MSEATTTFTTATASSYGLILNSNSGTPVLTVAAAGTYTLNGIVQNQSANGVTIAANAGGFVVIGSERNLVINMDNSAPLSITAPIANNGSTGGTGGTASAVTIASTAPTGTTPGVVSFNGTHTFSGQLSVVNGQMNINTINNESANGVLGNSALSVILGGSGGQTGTLGYTAATGTSTKKFTLATGGTGAFVILTNNVLTLNGEINGGGNLSKTQGGTLALGGTNTYTGATNITGGVLSINHASALGGNTPGTNGTSAITMSSGSRLAPTLTGVVINAPITVDTTGTTVTISAPPPLVASQALADSVLTLGGAIGGAGNVTFNSTQNANNLNNILLTTQSTYAGSTLMDTTAPTGSGSTSNHQIVVRLGITDALPTTTVLTIDGKGGNGTGRVAEFVMNGFNQTLAGLSNVTRSLRVQRVVNSDVSAASTLTINGSVDSTFGGAIGVNGAFSSMSVGNFPGSTNGNNILLVKNGTGTFALTGSNFFSGKTTVSGGILSLGNASALSQSPLDTTGSIAGNATNGLRTTVTTLTMGGLTGNKNFANVFETTSGGYSGLTALTLNPVLGATHTYSGDIGNGNGTMSLTKSSEGTQVLSSTNSYTGSTTISRFTLRINSIADYNAASSIGSPASGDLVIGATNTGVLDYVGSGNSSNRTITVGSSTAANGGGAFILANGGAALTFTALAFNTAQATATVARTLTLGGTGIGAVNGTVQDNNTAGGGTVALTKQDAGTWTLSGANTYTGLTRVNGGTLVLGADNALPATPVSIGTATLNASTFDDTLGTLDAVGSAVINLGAGANLVFADSSGVNSGTWTGTLNITGTFVSGSSLRFGDGTGTGLTPDQLLLISASGFTGFGLDANGFLTATGGGGPGPLDNFLISAISSPQTVGTPITGITLTARDASNATVTSFTGTVNFGGTGGFTGTSATFTAGVLSGVSVLPTNAGSGLTFTVTDIGTGKTGSATITTIQTQYTAWAGGAVFTADANGDGVNNGVAFLLGAANPTVNAIPLLPVATQSGGNLIMTFKSLNAAKRGGAVLNVQYSRDLGITDLWASHTAAVPETSGTVNSVVFATSVFDVNLNNNTATIPASAATPGTKLFGRLSGVSAP